MGKGVLVARGQRMDFISKAPNDDAGALEAIGWTEVKPGTFGTTAVWRIQGWNSDGEAGSHVPLDDRRAESSYHPTLPRTPQPQ
jgi:hypothetical protein